MYQDLMLHRQNPATGWVSYVEVKNNSTSSVHPSGMFRCLHSLGLLLQTATLGGLHFRVLAFAKPPTQ